MPPLFERLWRKQVDYCFGCPAARTGAPQRSNDLGEFAFDVIPTRFIAQKFKSGGGDVFGRGVVLDELGKNLFARQEIRLSKVLHLNNSFGDLIIAPGELNWSNGGSGNPINVSNTTPVTATRTIGGCVSGASAA